MRSVVRLSCAWALLSTFPAFAAPQPSAPTVAPSTPLTLQQQFDAGEVAINSRDWPKAEAIYTALETRVSLKSTTSKILPVIQIRKGLAIYHQGTLNDAERLISSALAKINIADPTLRSDRLEGLDVLGTIAASRFNYPEAIQRYRDAIELAEGANSKIQLLVKMSRIEIFVDPQQALTDINSSFALVTGKSKVDLDNLGVLRDIRGRVLLNLGRVKEARADFSSAIRLLGGLETGKFDLNDASARSDGAIGALLAKDDDTAKRLLAYSGAGDQGKQGFQLGSALSVPDCGGPNGPSPQDVAVIELSIGDDGNVVTALPIYFSGKPLTAITFAKEVSAWRWNPQELSKIDKFFRYMTRVELRCTSVFNRPNASTLLAAEFEKWLAGVLSTDARELEVDGVTGFQQLKQELSLREATHGPQSPKLLGLLVLLSLNSAVGLEQATEYSRRAYEISQTVKTPASVQAYLGLSYWKFLDRGYKLYENPVAYQREITKALSDQKISSDATATGALRVALFDSYNKSTRVSNGQATLQPLVDDPAREPNDPFRVAALVRLANLSYGGGNLDKARQLFEKSGLSAQQCALVDAKPAISAGNITSNDYPIEALRWGFTGWTMVEFDIDADGKTLNTRPIVSWPPFVFGDIAAAGIKKFRYEQSYRPGGGLGCGGQRQSVRYQIPG